MPRYYYRCKLCCHVLALEGRVPPETRCACDGNLALVGRVGPSGKGLVRDVDRCPCDARCTSAPGPRCECSCGGVNHGTGRLATIQVDAGGVPRVCLDSAAECQQRAAEYRSAVAPLKARIRELTEARSPMARPSDEESRLRDVLAYVWGLKTHKGRMRALASTD